MTEWMDEWMSRWNLWWMNECWHDIFNGMVMNESCGDGWMNGLMNGWWDEWMNVGWMNVVIDEWWMEWWIVNEALWSVLVVICKCVCNVLHGVLIRVLIFQGQTYCTHDEINPLKCTKILLFFMNPKHFLVAFRHLGNKHKITPSWALQPM